MIRLIAWLLIHVIGFGLAHAADATPSDMYAQALRIEREVDALKRHFKISAKATVEAKAGDLKPRHIRAQSYILLYKVSKLRRKHGLAYIQPSDSEPTLDARTSQPWGTLQRVLTEIEIFKHYLDIPGQAGAASAVPGKRTIDLYNKLHQISGELDLLTGPITPSEVYGEVKRLNEDANAVLRHLHIFEKGIPPPRRENLSPRDSLRTVFEMLGQVQRIQRMNGLETVDLKGFDMADKTVPDDVFGLVALTLAEWQRVKLKLGMSHHITVPASFEENKTPSDVVQLLGYVTDKLHEIR